MLSRKISTPDRLEWQELVLELMNHRQMKEVNGQVFGRKWTTDVISQAYGPMVEGEGWSGEIFVNVERAAELDGVYGRASRELALYIAHGCNHLTGADDARPEDRRRMRRKENAWLVSLLQQHLTEGLIYDL